MLIQFTASSGYGTFVKEIPNTKLLVSLNYFYKKAANMAIFDLSKKVAKKIYSFEEVLGGKSNSNYLNSEDTRILSINTNKAISRLTAYLIFFPLVVGHGDVAFNEREEIYLVQYVSWAKLLITYTILNILGRKVAIP